MKPLTIDNIKFNKPKNKLEIIKLPGNIRKENFAFRHVSQVKVFNNSVNVLVCLVTDIKSKEYTDKWKQYK